MKDAAAEPKEAMDEVKELEGKQGAAAELKAAAKQAAADAAAAAKDKRRQTAKVLTVLLVDVQAVGTAMV